MIFVTWHIHKTKEKLIKRKRMKLQHTWDNGWEESPMERRNRIKPHFET